MREMDALPVLASWFAIAALFFAAIGTIVRRLDDSDHRHRRYGIPRDTGKVAERRRSASS
jgi:hypothetical protein